MTAPLFYVENLPDTGTVTLAGEAARHAVSAMRLSPGETVLVGDGHGSLAACTVLSSDRRAGLTAQVGAVEEVPAARRITVVQAIPKGERGDLCVELLTETGVSVIVPWASARAVADWRGKENGKVQRWRRVARAAAKQARRAYIPEVADPVTGIPESGPQCLVLHEDAPDSLFDIELPQGPMSVVVGPEGGLTEQEVTALAAQGAHPVRLGAEILRTSTAGAAACLWIRGLEKRMGT